MQLLQRVLILALCVATAYILPATLANVQHQRVEDALYDMVLAQVHSAAMIDTRAISPGEAGCASEYNNATATINNRMLNQTNLCFENANKTQTVNAANVNKTVAGVRSNLLDVQNQVANCSNYTDVNLLLNCTVSTFQINLQHLDKANNLAYQGQVEIAMNENQVILAQEACINAAIDEAKTNLTIAANAYSRCLSNIKYQRLVLGIN